MAFCDYHLIQFHGCVHSSNILFQPWKKGTRSNIQQNPITCPQKLTESGLVSQQFHLRGSLLSQLCLGHLPAFPPRQQTAGRISVGRQQHLPYLLTDGWIKPFSITCSHTMDSSHRNHALSQVHILFCGINTIFCIRQIHIYRAVLKTSTCTI